MGNIEINGIPVYGLELDQNSRCKHYHGENDVIAIRLKCCDRYYACCKCHEELESHKIIPWPTECFGEKAVLCGRCGHDLTIAEYLNSNYRCPYCSTAFNLRCSLHYPIYFCM
jgi:uncharacterized CHY-type Zn-finger protein